MPSRPTTALLTVCLFAAMMLPTQALAFCGFYVSSGSSELYNESTQVTLMRHELTTVLSMRNTYRGPAEDFAMVVPVPVVLKQDEVRTLRDELFDELDRHTAPRLVEYFEQDPCMPQSPRGAGVDNILNLMDKSDPPEIRSVSGGGVKVEAKFEVDEYEVVILSAREATALETWLADNAYNVPKGASKVLQGYITQGMYFFVAKVNIDKVKLDKEGRALLSPLRFHYDSEDFSLPVRLGLLNADGPQDLIIHILAKDRYNVANYDNAFIPTNLIVKEKVREDFGLFYRTLFDYALAQSENAVITEYAWQAGSCDPCPAPPLGADELDTLGFDVIQQALTASAMRQESLDALKQKRRSHARPPTPRPNFVLTRLHARYTAAQLEQDLIFQIAAPVTGGRGVPRGKRGEFEEMGAQENEHSNQFQGRYVMLNAWEAKLTCEEPTRHIWGNPPAGKSSRLDAAADTALGKRKGLKLSKVIMNSKKAGLKALK